MPSYDSLEYNNLALGMRQVLQYLDETHLFHKALLSTRNRKEKVSNFEIF